MGKANKLIITSKGFYAGYGSEKGEITSILFSEGIRRAKFLSTKQVKNLVKKLSLSNFFVYNPYKEETVEDGWEVLKSSRGPYYIYNNPQVSDRWFFNGRERGFTKQEATCRAKIKNLEFAKYFLKKAMSDQSVEVKVDILEKTIDQRKEPTKLNKAGFDSVQEALEFTKLYLKESATKTIQEHQNENFTKIQEYSFDNLQEALNLLNEKDDKTKKNNT